jgi:hypothetical protein
MDLLELHSLIRKELSLIPLSRELNLRWRVPFSNGCLILRIRCDSFIDIKALTSRVVGVIGRVGVGGAKIVVQRVHVGLCISEVVMSKCGRTELRIWGLRGVQVLGSWSGRNEVEGGA